MTTGQVTDASLVSKTSNLRFTNNFLVAIITEDKDYDKYSYKWFAEKNKFKQGYKR